MHDLKVYHNCIPKGVFNQRLPNCESVPCCVGDINYGVKSPHSLIFSPSITSSGKKWEREREKKRNLHHYIL